MSIPKLSIKTWLIIACGVLVLGVVFAGFKATTATGRLKEAQANFAREKETTLAELKLLTKERDKYIQEAKDAKESAAKHEADSKAKDKEIEKEKVKQFELEKKYRTLDADAVTKLILGYLAMDEKEVWKNSFGVQFSLKASQETLIKLSDQKSLRFTLLPAEIAKNGSLVLANEDLKTGIGKLEKAIKTDYIAIEKYKFLLGENERLDKAYKREKFWKTFTLSTETPIILILTALLLFGK
jgi:hypothetical protein